MATLEERVVDVEYHLAQLAHAQLKTEMALQELSNGMLDFKKEMLDFKGEMEKDRKRMNKAWGDLANKMGTIVEDIVAPNIRRLAVERFGCDPLEFFAPRVFRRGPDGVMREFDVIAAGGQRVVLTESKSTITAEAVGNFAAKLGMFFDHFPEWNGREIIPILASWSVEETACQALTAARIYGLEMGEDTMSLVNDGAF